eukprot:GHVU01009856.1.p2 GENE.GHVU01009856.1~~GHVU01009856.1.p2  ORF type:complete len:117 (+),score=11.21 GHVU01009856.1:1023-1373(+)
MNQGSMMINKVATLFGSRVLGSRGIASIAHYASKSSLKCDALLTAQQIELVEGAKAEEECYPHFSAAKMAQCVSDHLRCPGNANTGTPLCECERVCACLLGSTTLSRLTTVSGGFT